MKKHSMILALQLSFLGFAPCAFSQALEETTALLNSPTARDKVMQDDPAAKQAGDQVKALGLSPGGEAKVYDLSGKILEKLSVDTDGDPEKMQKKIDELSRDPASLEKVLTDDQKTQIHIISADTHAK
jgi:hypothetical protein